MTINLIFIFINTINILAARQQPDDWYRLDPNKSVVENAVDIYRELSTSATSESRRTSLLNGFTKLLIDDNYDTSDNLSSTTTSTILTAFSVEEYFYCISTSLAHQFTQVRAASLRAIRRLMLVPQDLIAFNEMQLPHLVCRSLDVLLDNEEERMQAMKLVSFALNRPCRLGSNSFSFFFQFPLCVQIRRMIAVDPKHLSPIIVRSLVSLGESVAEDGDRMLRVCLAILSEFGGLNPNALIMCGGVSAITRNVLECHSPRIAESLVGVLLYMLERPETRHLAGVRLDCLAAPYCDFTYRLGIMDKNK